MNTTFFSLHRVGAMVLRYIYLMRGSWPRMPELIYWPTMQMILWGFISQFLVTNSSWVAQASGVLLAGVLLWDVMFRGQLGVSVVFFEEMLWSIPFAAIFFSRRRCLTWFTLLSESRFFLLLFTSPGNAGCC